MIADAHAHQKALLVTGPGHSATRLLVSMFDKHPDVSVPMGVLNHVLEYKPLHEFFIQAMDNTAISSPEYAIDRDDLFFLLDAYMQTTDSSKPFILLKMPFYPLVCMDMFYEYFDGRVQLLYTHRPVDKVVRSYLRRGSDVFYFQQKHSYILQQIKKLDISQRTAMLADLDPEAFFRAVVHRCDQLRDQWNAAHPDQPFMTVNVEQLTTGRDHLTDLLHCIQISDHAIDDMLAAVDAERLVAERHQPADAPSWGKAVVRECMPPVITGVLKKIIRR